MSGMSDYSAQAFLNWVVGKTAMPALPTHTYLALFTAVGSDSGSGFTEVSGGSYARVAVETDFAAATGSAPSTIQNNTAIAFATATASWGTVEAFGFYDALTAGDLLFWDYLGNFTWQPCTISSASPGVITEHAHGYSAADNVVYSTEFGGALPTFSASNLTGLLAVVSPTTDTFTVTNGGTAVNTSSTGSGSMRKVVPQSVPSGVQASFASGALILSAA